MPVLIDELQSKITLMDRAVSPGGDLEEMGMKLSELEARVQALEESISVTDGELKFTAKKISLIAQEELRLEGANSTIRMIPGSFTMTSAGSLKIVAAITNLDSGLFAFSGPQATFSGIVKCETLITTTVIATNYTPGAGNVW